MLEQESVHQNVYERHIKRMVGAFYPDVYKLYKKVFLVRAENVKRNIPVEVDNMDSAEMLARLAVLDVQTTIQADCAAIELPSAHAGREYTILTARMHLMHAREKIIKTIDIGSWSINF